MSFPGASWGLSEMLFTSYAHDVKSQNPGQGLWDKPSPPPSDYLNIHASTCQKLLFWKWSSALFPSTYFNSYLEVIDTCLGKNKVKKKKHWLFKISFHVLSCWWPYDWFCFFFFLFKCFGRWQITSLVSVLHTLLLLLFYYSLLQLLTKLHVMSLQTRR